MSVPEHLHDGNTLVLSEDLRRLECTVPGCGHTQPAFRVQQVEDDMSAQFSASTGTQSRLAREGASEPASEPEPSPATDEPHPAPPSPQRPAQAQDEGTAETQPQPDTTEMLVQVRGEVEEHLASFEDGDLVGIVTALDRLRAAFEALDAALTSGAPIPEPWRHA